MPKLTRGVTAVLMIVSAVVILGYDAIVGIFNNVSGDTISEIKRDLSYLTLANPYVWGFLMGHWFWNGARMGLWAWGLGAGVLVLVAAASHLYQIENTWSVLGVFWLGFLLGRLAWAQPPAV